MNKNTKIIIGIIALITTLSIGFGIGYMYSENTKENEPIKEEKNEDQKNELNYELKKYGQCDKLYINGIYTGYIGLDYDIESISDVLLFSYVGFNEQICSSNEKISWIPSEYGSYVYAMNTKGETITSFESNKSKTGIKLKGERVDNFEVYGNKIDITSDNLQQDAEAVVCDSNPDYIVEYTEEFEYLENGKFSNSRIINTQTAKEYRTKNNIKCY